MVNASEQWYDLLRDARVKRIGRGAMLICPARLDTPRESRRLFAEILEEKEPLVVVRVRGSYQPGRERPALYALLSVDGRGMVATVFYCLTPGARWRWATKMLMGLRRQYTRMFSLSGRLRGEDVSHKN